MSKEIPVMGSKQNAIVDDEDFDWASKHDWFLHSSGYVVRSRKPGEVGVPDEIEMGTEVLCRSRGIFLADFYAGRRPSKRRLSK